MAVTSAARVKITSAVMTSAAAECQLVSGSALGGTAGVACWYGSAARVGERPGRQVGDQRPEVAVRAGRVGPRHPVVELVLGEPSLGESRPEHPDGTLAVRAARQPGRIDPGEPAAGRHSGERRKCLTWTVYH